MRPGAHVLVALLLLPADAFPQGHMTIPEEAALVSPGPLYKTRIVEMVSLNVPRLVREADVILVCTVEEERVYLSDDQRELHTEFRATPIRVVKPRPPVATPPATPPIVVRQWGGRMVIGGVQVIPEHSNIGPLPVGEPLVLFLRKGADGVYTIVRSIDGAFLAANGRVRAMRYPANGAEQFAGMPLATFIDELHRMDSERPK